MKCDMPARMKYLALFTLLATLSLAIKGLKIDPECGDWEGAFYRHGFCYRLYDENSTWTQAQKKCGTLGPNSRLAEIASDDFADELQFILSKAQPDLLVWVGESASVQSTLPTVSSRWSDNCLVLSSTGLETQQCTHEIPYLCQELVDNPCWRYQSKSRFFEGFCFTFHQESQYKSRAVDICGSENATLAEPETLDLMNFLVEEASLQKDVYGTSRYYLGAEDLEVDGTFVWETSNRPFSPEINVFWSSEEPNGDVEENQVEALYRRNRFHLNDVNGETIKFSFICQKAIEMYSHVFVVRNDTISNVIHVTANTEDIILLTGAFLRPSGLPVPIAEMRAAVKRDHPFIIGIEQFVQKYEADLIPTQIFLTIVIKSTGHVTTAIYSQTSDGQFLSHLAYPTEILSTSYIIYPSEHYATGFRIFYIALDERGSAVRMRSNRYLDSTVHDHDRYLIGRVLNTHVDQYQIQITRKLTLHAGILVHANGDVLVLSTSSKAKSRGPILVPHLPLDKWSETYYTLITSDTERWDLYTVVAAYNDTEIKACNLTEIQVIHLSILLELEGDTSHISLPSHVPNEISGDKPFYIFKTGLDWDCNSQIIPPSLWRTEYYFTVPENLTIMFRLSAVIIAPVGLFMRLNDDFLSVTDCNSIINSVWHTCALELSVGHYHLRAGTTRQTFLAYLQGTYSTGVTFCHPLGVNHDPQTESFVYNFEEYGEDMTFTSSPISTAAIPLSHEPETTSNVELSTEEENEITTTEKEFTTTENEITTTENEVTTTENLSIQHTDIPMCPSTSLCRCFIPNPSATLKDPTESLQEIQKLRLPTNQTSSYRRKKVSVYDNRPTAVCVGMVGIALLVLVVLIIILPDTLSLVIYLVDFLKRCF